MIGSVLGSYTIVDRLGEGGMGVVYAAEHALLGRRAAIKVLLPDLSRRAEVVERFFNEARAMTSIGDAGVVQVFDFGHAPDGCAYIVMELLDGESLDDRLRRTGPLPARIALRIARQIATSLAAAHARGIIHRDLKPENIFLVRDAEAMDGERPKILDFGIAKLSEDNNRSKTRTGTFLGTPLYMSPEQCRGAGEVDARSDVYALGCVLFHLVAGRPPFDGAGVGEIVASHLREPAPAPSQVLPGVPASVDAVVARCLAKSPDERFASMSELAQALAAVQARLSAGLTGDRAAPDARTVIAADL
ncbi:MAG: serine/threonine protein kinase, partial [Deltaproteobacteria bacterium]|nr:serine/threonine protein kinase [Kofleriaceae bacterium]